MANGDVVIAVPVGKQLVEEAPAGRLPVYPTDALGNPARIVTIDGSASAASRHIVDVASGTLKADILTTMVRLTWDTYDAMAWLQSWLEFGKGSDPFHIRATVDPTDDDEAADNLATMQDAIILGLPGAPLGDLPLPGQAVQYIYIVGVTSPGSTLASSKGVFYPVGLGS